MVALYLTLASVTAVYCLLGYWLAFGKQYWLWRAAAFCVALVLLVPIQACEPLIFFAITSVYFVTVGGGLRLFQWWRERRRTPADSIATKPVAIKGRFQFRLHDLLGLMALIGAAAWMVRALMREEAFVSWPAPWLAGVFVGITIAVAELVAGRDRPISGGVLILLTAGLIAVFHFRFRPLSSVLSGVLGDYLGSYVLEFFFPWPSSVAVASLLALFVLFLTFGFGVQRALLRSRSGSSRERIWRGIATVTMTLGFAAYGWLYFQLMSFPKLPSKDRQQANSFPLILERGGGLEFVSPAQARVIAADVLKLTEQPGFVVLPWNGTYFERRNSVSSGQTARSICRGLDAQLAATEPTNPAQAADYAVGILRIGEMLGHEGEIMESQLGMALEEWGRTHLARLRNEVSDQKKRELLRELKRVEDGREPLDVAIRRQEAWAEFHDRWRFRLYKTLVLNDENAIGWEGSDAYDNVQVSWKRYACPARLLIIDLALRVYHLDHGEHPRHLSDLAPEYLTQIPLDPFSDQPFIYRPGDSGFVLYSIGSDGVDNGGFFGNMQKVVYHPDGLDWDVDALTRP